MKTTQNKTQKIRKKAQVQMIPMSVVLPLLAELPEGYRLSAFIEKKGRTQSIRYDVNIIATRDNIGYAVLKRVKGKLFLDGVFVLPSHRNKGIASYILHTVLLNNHNEDISLMARPFKDKSVGKDELIKLYERFGFQTVDKSGLMIKKASSL